MGQVLLVNYFELLATILRRSVATTFAKASVVKESYGA